MKLIYFTHIPKTAGTTIEDISYKTYEKTNKEDVRYLIGNGYFYKFLKKKNSNDDISVYKYYLKNKYFTKLFLESKKGEEYKEPWFCHIPIGFWKENLILELKKKYTVFCIVRNPYDKFVSAFKFWIYFYNNKNNFKTKHGSLMVQFLKIVYENNFEITKDNLNKMAKKLFKSKKYEYSFDCHLLEQYKYIYTKMNGKIYKIVDIILKFENLNKEFEILKKKYLPLIPDNSLSNTHLFKSSKDVTTDDLDEESKDLIYKYYEKDFKLFGYKK